METKKTYNMLFSETAKKKEMNFIKDYVDVHKYQNSKFKGYSFYKPISKMLIINGEK